MNYLRKTIKPDNESEIRFLRWIRREQHAFREFRRRAMRDAGAFCGRARGLPLEVSRPMSFYDTQSLE